MTTIGGKYRNDMTWNTQVDSVDINGCGISNHLEVTGNG